MLKRLWIVVCTLWSVFVLWLAYMAEDPPYGALAFFFVTPWAIGYAIPYVLRFIFSGNPRSKRRPASSAQSWDPERRRF